MMAGLAIHPDPASGEHDKPSSAGRAAALEDRERAAAEREAAVTSRELAARAREQLVAQREEAADQRDQAAGARDLVADQRDRASEEYDETRATHDAVASRLDDASEALSREATVSLRAARSEGGMDRKRASGDRRFSAADRVHAGADRVAAARDRDSAARDLASAHIDELTGVLQRGAGYYELGRELARARRSGEPLVLGFADVVGLKAINDQLSHSAGDQVLRDVADALRAHLRAYDPIVRYGGDEFVFSLEGLSLAQARDRAAAVNASLRAGGVSVTIGLAELGDDDSLDTLVSRADAELYEQRCKNRSGSVSLDI